LVCEQENNEQETGLIKTILVQKGIFEVRPFSLYSALIRIPSRLAVKEYQTNILYSPTGRNIRGSAKAGGDGQA
jgi:hypothetical protein